MRLGDTVKGEATVSEMEVGIGEGRSRGASRKRTKYQPVGEHHEWFVFVQRRVRERAHWRNDLVGEVLHRCHCGDDDRHKLRE